MFATNESNNNMTNATIENTLTAYKNARWCSETKFTDYLSNLELLKNVSHDFKIYYEVAQSEVYFKTTL